MGKYIVTKGQNLFDVAMHIYGSIEGIPDLLINNPNISFSTELKEAQPILYTDEYIINSDVVAFNRYNDVIPANSKRSVYYKQFPDTSFEITLKNTHTSFNLFLTGTGNLLIEWGDNSMVQQIELSGEIQKITHLFDNLTSSERRIRLSGEFTLRNVSIIDPGISQIYFLQPIHIEKLQIRNADPSLDFLRLCEGIYDLQLENIQITDLSPLIECKHLLTVDLSKTKLKQRVMDDYLIRLVKEYYGRMHCKITLPHLPSGEYEEPLKDGNGNYIIDSGMKAIWVIVNEPAWNESGYWRFIVEDQIFSSEPNT